MNLKMRFFIPTLLSFLSLLILSNCSEEAEKNVEKFERPSISIDLAEILKRGKLTVLAENSSTSFFIYRGKKMGFEYEILKEFANELGVELEIKIVNNLDDLTEMLNNGEGDLIACNYTVTRERSKIIDFSVPILRTPQVLIQRKPEGWEEMEPIQIEKKLLRDPAQLMHKKVHVWKNSSYYRRLMHLQEEIGDTIFIMEEDGKIGGEELIEMVSEGLIDYTVTEANIAKINQRFFENLDIATEISVRQKIAFGMRKSSPLLNVRLDKWLTNFMVKKTFKYLKSKYFDWKKSPVKAADYLAILKGGQLSKFDAIFKKAAAKSGGLDWQLIASVAYQESKFNPNVVGFGGAYGMMQFMPNTGPKYGVYPNSTPEVQINGAMKKMNSDFNNWINIPDKAQREKFTLATYNAGKGHVEDAQRLARKHGLNPFVWDDNVEQMLLNLSKSEYYRDEVVRNGAMRGAHTYKYVRTIYARYLEWKSVYK
jgi:membrane-bound lytic murein transglycosylase F